jgi:DNA repair photolyase
LSTSKNPKPSRGTKLHLANKYLKLNHLETQDLVQELHEEDKSRFNKTKYVEVVAKSMINQVTSPDLFMDYSLNPYQGCEHGCVYCYARPTHNYWGYSAADDFENTILVKKNAVEILKLELSKKNYEVKPIMLSGNTDCYQPAERKYKITRSILDLLLKWKHPVQIISKNSLILRDLDLLIALNELTLCSVAVSITASTDVTRRIMEPRASTIESRMKIVKTLSENKIPVHVMLAPIIPGINDTELITMVKNVSALGANSASYQIVRLNGDLQPIFENFLSLQLPDRKEKVLNAIKSCHDGQLNDSRFGLRMKGEGNVAQIIKQQFKLAYSKYFPNPKKIELRKDLFSPVINGQMRIW